MIFSLIAVSILTAPAADLPEVARQAGLNAAQWAEVQKGSAPTDLERFKTPEGKDAGRAKTWVLINAPIDKCFDTLYRYEAAPEYLPRVTKVEIKDKTETRMRVTQTIEIWPMDFTYTMDFTYNRSDYTMHWDLVKSLPHDIGDTIGDWKFYRLDDSRTLLLYKLFADTGYPVPAKIENMLTKGDLPEVVQALKRRVESNGKFKK